MNSENVVPALLITTVILALVGMFTSLATRETSVEKAVRLCENTGGTLLVTEYSDEKGLVFNCFYPEGSEFDYSGL